MNNQLNNICICGHSKSIHTGFWDLYGTAYPDGCRHTFYNDSSCLCFVYKQDNLKYLEMKYEQRL